jgi:hypothetical protein
MISRGHFTACDLSTIERASALAESLTQDFFGLGKNEWALNPYGIFTIREVDTALFMEDVFAQVIRYQGRPGSKRAQPRKDSFAIVLQDPNILQALLRSTGHSLWTIGLFVLTHELVHIVRFRKFNTDFCAPEADRDREEKVVQGITGEILAGVSNTDNLLNFYRPPLERMIDEM